MPEITKIELNGKQLIPRELTVREVEAVMESLGNENLHILESMCPDIPIPASAVATSVGVELEDLKDILPSQVPELFRQVKEKNSFLAQAVENLAGIASKMLADQGPDSTTSAALSAD